VTKIASGAAFQLIEPSTEIDGHQASLHHEAVIDQPAAHERHGTLGMRFTTDPRRRLAGRLE
jgi:hypothetical protein